jgi:hypothetical protein
MPLVAKFRFGCGIQFARVALGPTTLPALTRALRPGVIAAHPGRGHTGRLFARAVVPPPRLSASPCAFGAADAVGLRGARSGAIGDFYCEWFDAN